MADNQIRIRARIHLLTTEEGGRATPLQGGGSYRPNHNFFGPDSREMCVGSVDLVEGQAMEPGDTIETEMMLSVWPDLAGEIHEGRSWRIQEGPKFVGIGTVLSVLETR